MKKHNLKIFQILDTVPQCPITTFKSHKLLKYQLHPLLMIYPFIQKLSNNSYVFFFYHWLALH